MIILIGIKINMLNVMIYMKTECLFFYMPFEFQIGIIIKFAEKVGYRISIKYNQKSNWTYEVVHDDFGSTNTTEIKSYKKACKLAILEFNKRYNNTWESL